MAVFLKIEVINFEDYIFNNNIFYYIEVNMKVFPGLLNFPISCRILQF